MFAHFEGQISASRRLKMIAEVGQLSQVGKLNNPANILDFAEALEKRSPHLLTPPLVHQNQDTFLHTLHLLHMSWLWSRESRPVLRLSHGLAAALMLTEPVKLAEGEALELPFPAFAVLIPERTVPVFKYKQQMWGDLLWVYSFIGRHRSDGRITPFLRWIVEKDTVQVWRDRFPSRVDEVEDERLYSLGPDEPVPEEEDQVSLNSALRLIRNLCSWLSATKALAKVTPTGPSRKRKSHDEKLRLRTWDLGNDVKTAPELREVAAEISLGRTSHAVEGWRLRARHMVSGHWRNQPYGEGLKQRKLVWISPYWKGPEGEELWAHLKKK